MGAEKTTLHVENIFERYKIKRAINIGIAGCREKSIEIGSIFCTNHKLSDMDFLALSSHDKPVDDESGLVTTLVDMEAESFLKICKKEMEDENIFVFKVVSDYLSATIPKKEFVESLIGKSIKRWERYV